jgi:hypothetical protein
VTLTSSEEVLLAANKIVEKGPEEFTEWQLTVETWLLNKQRWGLRGYEEKYPDHKRVMNEIMAKGTQKVLGKGWLKRLRPNYYSVTSAGKARAAALSEFKVTKRERSLLEYDAVKAYISNPVFEKYCKNPKEPKTWLGAASFLGLTKNDPILLERNLKMVKEAINSAIEWMEKNSENMIRRSDSSTSISKEQLKTLSTFLNVLEQRFKPQFDAIRAKKK